jgi:peptidoglycan/LPS O-acetylase OafA/YrhL
MTTIPERYSNFRQTKYFASLDGLRAISILAVIFYHVPELRPYWRTGYLGVHLFFVISGFLITTLLLREKAKAGRIALKDFYVRRTLRIFPAYYLTLLLFLAACLLVPELRRDALPTYLHNLPSFASYTSNWFVYPWGPGKVVFVAAWSLATEEQFYLFWPWIIAFSRRWYVPAIVMLVLIAINQSIKMMVGYEFFLAGHSLPVTILNSISTAICLGCLLAITLDRERGFAWFWRLLGASWSAPVFLVLTFVVSAIPNSDTLEVGHMMLVTFAMTLTVGACCIREDHWAKLLLTNPVARYLGLVSYGLYLYHAFGINIADRYFGFVKPWPALQFLVVVLCTLVLASLSYWLFEKRFLDLKKRFSRSRTEPVTGPVHSITDPAISNPTMPN